MDILIMLIFILIGIALIIIKSLQKRNLTLDSKVKNPSFSILIPARYESKVIESLLISINKQSVKVNPKDVYIIVESLEDETCNIVKKYNMNIILRDKLDLKRKGYALEEAFDYLKKKNKIYDLYFIFDADNILDKYFIKEMLITYKNGYDIACGYRALKNKKFNIYAYSSILSFSLLNTVANQGKAKNNLSILLSGTGFYFSKEVIKNGYNFHSLTEDYELSLYSIINNFTSTYNPKAIYYDEQAEDYKTTVTQRIRWIKGYFEVRKKYMRKFRKNLFSKHLNRASIIDEYLGMIPYFFISFATFCFIILNLIKFKILNILLLFLFSYLILILITIYLLFKEQDKIKLNIKQKILIIFYNPIFTLSYIPCFIKAICTKNVEWKRIDHNNN